MSSYATLDDAIYEAANATRESTSDKTEAITAIYKRQDGSFGFGAPVSQGKRKGVSASLKFPKGSALAALVHNHPGAGDVDEGQSEFSAADVEMAKSLGIPSAITFGSDMSIRTYLPGVDKLLSHRGSNGGKSQLYSAGSPFDYIPEVKVAAKKYGGVLESLLK